MPKRVAACLVVLLLPVAGAPAVDRASGAARYLMRAATAVPGTPPMSYLRTFGPAADPATRLNWGLLGVSVLVIVLIGACMLWAMLRRRPALKGDGGPAPLGPERGGMLWIYLGVGITSVVLLACTAWTLLTLSALAAPGPGALTIDVIGHQWWWELRYAASAPSAAIVSANEIHIPTGEPVILRLRSDDVIHSFWVPQLAGKTDMVPGQLNTAWIQADRDGDYRGQCAEYCGAQHAHMALHVIAQERAAFAAWREQQLAAGARPESDAGVRGMGIFQARCASCHTVRGSGAGAALGPDLSHLMSRHMIAAGMLPNNTGSLSGWVADAPAIKPGARMPRMELSPAQLHDVVSYLETLK